MPATKQTVRLPRQPDGDALYLHFTGGVRAAKVGADAWRIEPVLIDGAPCIIGPLTQEELQSLVATHNLQAVAFHSIGWTDGCYNSNWKPIIPGRENHVCGPADLWRNISSNYSRKRTAKHFADQPPRDLQEAAEALDDREPEEALAQYVSLSLRSMDVSVGQIMKYYHEQLVNLMALGKIKGELTATMRDQILFAHVHSFFLHLGTARDYLAALIAKRIRLDHARVDSMARLVERLRQPQLPADGLLDCLLSSGYIAPHPEKQGKFAVAGWMEEVTRTRNEIVHNRPYGSKFSERHGQVCSEDSGTGIYRYSRSFKMNDGTNGDVLDVIQHHYSRCASFFQQAAERSGYDISMMNITDTDVIAVE